MKSLLTFLLFVGLGLLIDTFGIMLPRMTNPSRFPPQYHEWLTVATEIPWTSVLFGLLFPLAVIMTGRSKRTLGAQHVGEFLLLCPLVAICLKYAGVFLAMVLSSVGIPPYFVLPGLFCLMIGLIIQHGLFVPIGGGGLVLLLIFGSGVYVAPQYAPIPTLIQGYPYTLISIIAIGFSLKERPAV